MTTPQCIDCGTRSSIGLCTECRTARRSEARKTVKAYDQTQVTVCPLSQSKLTVSLAMMDLRSSLREMGH